MKFQPLKYGWIKILEEREKNKTDDGNVSFLKLKRINLAVTSLMEQLSVIKDRNMRSYGKIGHFLENLDHYMTFVTNDEAWKVKINFAFY